MNLRRTLIVLAVLAVALGALATGIFVGYSLFFDDGGSEQNDDQVVTDGFGADELPDDIDTGVPVDSPDREDIRIDTVTRSYMIVEGEKFHRNCRTNSVEFTVENHRPTDVVVELNYTFERVGAPDIYGTGAEVHIEANNTRTIMVAGQEVLGGDFCIERHDDTEPHLVNVAYGIMSVRETNMTYNEWSKENRITYDGEIRYPLREDRDLVYNAPLKRLAVGDEVYVDLTD